MNTPSHLSRYLVTTSQMRHLEQATVEDGASWNSLMERAGTGVAREILRLPGASRKQRVLVLVGPGNNGGDGLVAARHLHDAGLRVSLYVWGREYQEQDANWYHCRQRRLPETLATEDRGCRLLRNLLTDTDVVIDSLLGMGISRTVAGKPATMVETVNTSRQSLPSLSVVAVDIPTGIHSDSGAVMGVAVRADVTVATGLVKRGVMLYPGKDHAGRIAVVDIGIPPTYLETIMSETINDEPMRKLLPARPADAHKGTFGKVLVVAGSLHYPGAAALATGGAGRVGAGVVTLAAARSMMTLTGRGPEVTLLPLPEADVGTPGLEAAQELLTHLASYQAMLIGPGLGKEKATRLFLQTLLGIASSETQPSVGFLPLVVGSGKQHTEPPSAGASRSAGGKKGSAGFRPTRADTESADEAASQEQGAGQDGEQAADTTHVLPPTVLDADALNILSEMEAWSTHLPAERCILTPHPGEMKRLLKTERLDADPVQVATDAAGHWKQVVVLKGATTVVAAPDGRSAVHTGGNPALATAGTGDVLAGAIAGLLAQGMALFDAAVLGVFLHAAAGALVREELGEAGTLASDVLARLPRAIKNLREGGAGTKV